METFDCVSHGLLIGKLSRYSFERLSLQLVSSHFDESSISSPKWSEINKVMYTAGFHLEYSLFIIFIYDIVSCQSQHLVMYAGDTSAV
nr:unnamed protein product [Callosobruchus analis]